MIAKIATCLLAATLCTACTTTQTASNNGGGRQTLEQRLLAQNAPMNPNSAEEPMPPAEGPEDIPAEGPVDPNRNPALLPSPLLRANAAAGL